MVFSITISQNNNELKFLCFFFDLCWNISVIESFLDLANLYCRHSVYADGGRWYYHENQLDSSLQKDIIVGVLKYVIDSTGNLYDYYPCIQVELPD